MYFPRMASMAFTTMLLVVPLAIAAPARTKTSITDIDVYDLPASSSSVLTLSEKIQVLTTTLLVPHSPASATALASPSNPKLSAAEKPVLTTTLITTATPAPVTILLSEFTPTPSKKTETLTKHLTQIPLPGAPSPVHTITSITDVDVLPAPEPTLAPSESENRCFPLGTLVCNDASIVITTTHDMIRENSLSDFIQRGGVTGTSEFDLYGTKISATTTTTTFVQPTRVRYFDLESGEFVTGPPVFVSSVTQGWV